MTATRSATEIGLIGNRKLCFNTSCLPTKGDVMRYFFYIFKNQNATTNKKNSWLHSKQLLKIFESWKESMIEETLIMDFFKISFFHDFFT